MKKIFIFITILLFILIISGCDAYTSFENGVTLKVPNEIKENLVFNGELPTWFFNYPGKLTVGKSESTYQYSFVKNDFYQISDAYYSNMEKFNDRFVITKQVIQTYDDGYARFGKEKLPLDGDDKSSYEIMKVLWDQDGTRYSMQYRTFESGGKKYYSYWYTTNMQFTMEIPLLVGVKDGKNKLYMIALPFDTKYELSPATKLKSMLEKDEYLTDAYRTFNYPISLDYLSYQDKVIAIKDWYITYCNGQTIDNIFIFNYLGNKFSVTFNENNFQLSIL